MRITAGVDWAKNDHAVCMVGDQGEALDRFTVPHDAAGLKRMAARLLRAGVEQVGIERGDGPVVQTLIQAGLIVYVIPPGQVKNLRSRYGSAGNKDDRFDADVLADVVRTDVRRLRPMVYGSAQTTALRSAVRARRDLVTHRVAAANQLRAHLQIVFPRRRNALRRHRLGDHPDLPGTVHHPGGRGLCDFAGDSRRANPWTADLYAKATARGCDHPHAVRILARAWAHIIWRCWQDNVPYDPATHGALQTLLKQDQPTAA
jgi:transposase